MVMADQVVMAKVMRSCDTFFQKKSERERERERDSLIILSELMQIAANLNEGLVTDGCIHKYRHNKM